MKKLMLSFPLAIILVACTIGMVSMVSAAKGPAPRIDISQIHQNNQNPPVAKFHDMTFVFSEGD